MITPKQKRTDHDEEKRQLLTEIIMRAHVEVDVGMPPAKEAVFRQLGQELTNYHHALIVSIAIRHTFRNIEDFVQKVCNRKVVPIRRNEELEIRTPMIQCKKWMSEDHADTFYKFIRAECLGQKVTIKPSIALAVYQELITLARNPEQKRRILEEKALKNNIHGIQMIFRKIKLEPKKKYGKIGRPKKIWPLEDIGEQASGKGVKKRQKGAPKKKLNDSQPVKSEQISQGRNNRSSQNEDVTEQ